MHLNSPKRILTFVVFTIGIIFVNILEVKAVPADELWAILNKNTLALKDKDIAAYNATSLSNVKPSEESEFKEMAAFMYGMMQKVDKTKFVNMLQDEQQAIYFTDPEKADTTDSYQYKQSQIMFINKDGVWKLLVAILDNTRSVSKAGTNKTAEQVDDELKAMMLDSDKDGLTDREETCTGGQKYNPDCAKSDPNNKDTNANGWWDGIEAKMNSSS